MLDGSLLRQLSGIHAGPPNLALLFSIESRCSPLPRLRSPPFPFLEGWTGTSSGGIFALTVDGSSSSSIARLNHIGLYQIGESLLIEGSTVRSTTSFVWFILLVPCRFPLQFKWIDILNVDKV